jgi:hypothetical protein
MSVRRTETLPPLEAPTPTPLTVTCRVAEAATKPNAISVRSPAFTTTVASFDVPASAHTLAGGR